MSVEENIKSFLEDAKRLEMLVLIWGPGDPGDSTHPNHKYWEKRCMIRELLRREFPNAGVYFSEDEALRKYTIHLDDALIEEGVHAEKADCILVLDVSRGAHVEVDRFSALPLIAAKMRLLLPERYVGTKGLVSVIHKRVRVVGFSDQEFDECSLARKKCIDIIHTVAVSKLLADRNGGRYL